MAYVGWELDEADRAQLMRLIPTAYPDVIAHHVTLALGTPDSLVLPTETTGEVIGFVDDGIGVQALIIRINDTTNRPGGGTFHITWSIDREGGRKPVDSNKVIFDFGWQPFSVGWTIRLTPKIFNERKM